MFWVVQRRAASARRARPHPSGSPAISSESFDLSGQPSTGRHQLRPRPSCRRGHRRDSRFLALLGFDCGEPAVFSGEWIDRIIGLESVTVEVVMARASDGSDYRVL